jgi:hypothetical protein
MIKIANSLGMNVGLRGRVVFMPFEAWYEHPLNKAAAAEEGSGKAKIQKD